MSECDALFPGLFSGVEIAFQHQAHDGLAPVTKLSQHFPSNQGLARMVLAGIVMRAVDHDRSCYAFTGHRGFRFRDMFGIIISFTATPAQHDVAVRVAHGFDDRCLAVSVDPDKMVRGSG